MYKKTTVTSQFVSKTHISTFSRLRRLPVLDVSLRLHTNQFSAYSNLLFLILYTRL